MLTEDEVTSPLLIKPSPPEKKKELYPTFFWAVSNIFWSVVNIILILLLLLILLVLLIPC